MSKITNMDDKLREQVWTIAGRIEWTTDDWRDFYESLTAVFARIAARYAAKKIREAKQDGEVNKEHT